MLVIYSKNNCGQCLIIKKMCEKKKIDFIVKMLDVDFAHDELLSVTDGKARSYPQVFKDDEYIGDFTAAQKFVAKL